MKRFNEILLAIVVIGLSVAYQVHCAIHGFDLTDEGYLMSIYQWFCTDPEYAQGMGGYPLTCYLGSLLNGLTSGGILAMRLWGVAIVALTELLLYLYLRQHFSPLMVLAGLLIQTIFVAGDPKPFGYNTLTAFFGLLAFMALAEGALRGKYWLLFTGGLVLGVNVFVRLPNITCLAFLLIPYIANFESRQRLQLKRSTLQACTALVGFAIALYATWLQMERIGASEQIGELIASITGQLGGKSTHGSGAMISKYAGNYAMALWFAILFGITTFLAGLAFRCKNKLLMLVGLFATFMILYHNTYMRSNMLGDNFLSMMNGIGIAGACHYFNKGARLRTLSLGAILVSLVFPLGSDGGFQTMWVGSWLLLPVGLSGIWQFLTGAAAVGRTAHLTFSSPDETRHGLHLPARMLSYGYLFCLLTFLVSLNVKIEHKSYYDPGNRTNKQSAIHSPKARGVYAGADRAAIVNPLLDELKKYLKPGDVALFYDSSPLLYYLTDTRPFAGVSWPCVFYGQRYVDLFRQAEAKARRMPVLVMQYYFSSNRWTEVMPNYYLPQEEGGFPEEGGFSSSEMKRNILRFIGEHHYQTVWSNNYYEIMLPQEGS